MQHANLLQLVRFSLLLFKGFDIFHQKRIGIVLIFWFETFDLVCKDKMTVIGPLILATKLVNCKVKDYGLLLA